jgi:hypothetical protein
MSHMQNEMETKIVIWPNLKAVTYFSYPL